MKPYRPPHQPGFIDRTKSRLLAFAAQAVTAGPLLLASWAVVARYVGVYDSAAFWACLCFAMLLGTRERL